MKFNKKSLSLLTLMLSLTACGSGGGGGSGSNTIDPQPTPTPTPPEAPLQALVITQESLNLDKVGQHRIWHFTVKNPNNVDIQLNQMNGNNNISAPGNTPIYPFYFSVDNETPVGPANPIEYAVLGGSNNCLDIINKSTGDIWNDSTLKAGESCVYTINALWGANFESTSNFSFKLSYVMTNKVTRIDTSVKVNCETAPAHSSYLCATGTNNAINYTNISTNKKVIGLSPNIDQPMIGFSGNYLWNNKRDSLAVTRQPLNYDSATNTLTLGSIDYSRNITGLGGAGGNLKINHTGDIAYWSGSVFGSTVSDSYNILQEQMPPSVSISNENNRSIVGLNGVIYSNTGSTYLGQWEYVYPIDTATNTVSANNHLPEPVKFQGSFSY